MAKHIIDLFRERGFIEQSTDEESLRSTFNESSTCYIGFDPTAASFHIGSLVPIMALAHLQRAGHKPIALLGGGTALIGDPSGKTELRKMLSVEDIQRNAESLKSQLGRFIDFNSGAMLANNADWLTPLGYINFLREIGVHFSVNRMLAAESYKQRLETGLNFIEFNYMLLQAYDFLLLYQKFGCVAQMGGNDQWGNMVAGTDLVRRVESKIVHALTFPLITTSSGAKMGKTAKGAVWLDPELTSPYDFFQYWINTEDPDVERFLGLFTFLPMDEIKRLGALEGAEIRAAKKILAYETTKLVHGEAEADKAQKAAQTLFGSANNLDDIPTYNTEIYRLEEGIESFILFSEAGLTKSRGEARRLIQQGGAYVNDQAVTSIEHKISIEDAKDGVIILRAGKKKHMAIVPS